MYVVKMQHVYSHFMSFYRCFLHYADFYFLSFRHFNAGPMTLPTDVMQQCHPYVGQYMKVNTKVIPIPLHTKQYQIILLFLIF